MELDEGVAAMDNHRRLASPCRLPTAVHRCLHLFAAVHCYTAVYRCPLLFTAVHRCPYPHPAVQTCVRDDSTGLFWSTLCAPAPPAPPLLPPATSAMLACNNPLASTALQSLVSVSFHTPVMSDGVHGWAFVGVGAWVYVCVCV